MKSIILKPHELANIDRLAVVVRPIKEKSPDEREISYVDKTDADPTLFEIGFTMSDYVVRTRSPFSPGETAFVKEAFYYQKWLGIPLSERQPIVYASGTTKDQVEDYFFCNARYMPQWASRYHITIKEVEAKQAFNLVYGDSSNVLKSMGMPDFKLKSSPMTWIRNTYNCEEENSWLWLWKVEVKTV
jgi:hypothetical protein